MWHDFGLWFFDLGWIVLIGLMVVSGLLAPNLWSDRYLWVKIIGALLFGIMAFIGKYYAAYFPI